LVERTTSCASPAPTPQVGELAQKINTKFGALAQLVERTNRTLTPTPIHRVGKSAQKMNRKFGALAQLVERGTPTVTPEFQTPPQNVGQTSPNFIKRP